VCHQRQVLHQTTRLTLRGVSRTHHAPLAGVQGTGAGHLRKRGHGGGKMPWGIRKHAEGLWVWCWFRTPSCKQHTKD
jgi:hypothetical protein